MLVRFEVECWRLILTLKIHYDTFFLMPQTYLETEWKGSILFFDWLVFEACVEYKSA